DRPAVMTAPPVIEHAGGGDARRVAVTEELDLGRPAAEVLRRGVDEPEADVLRRARPAVNRVVVLDGGVDVLVALAEIRGEVAITPGVAGHPVERLRELGAKAGFGHRRRRIVRRVLEAAVGVDAGILAAEGVADLDVRGEVTARRRAGAVAHASAAGNPLNGHFTADATPGARGDGKAWGRTRPAGRLLR